MHPIEIFEKYVSLGYQIIPLFKGTKVPILSNWYKNYNIDSMRSIINKMDDGINFGLLLGKVIDIEGDCEDSNAKLDKILSKYDHPIFTSNKSRHHLFRSNLKNLTRIEKNGIEFRGHRHQSVIPPSQHVSGIKYEWQIPLVNINDLPFLPDFIEERLVSIISKSKPKKKINKKMIKPNHVESFCSNCKSKFFIDNKRHKNECKAFAMFNLKWTCKSCSNINIRKYIK